MNFATTRLMGMALFVAALISGCDTSPDPATSATSPAVAPVAPKTAGKETVTFIVKDMGKRLALI